MAKLRARGFAVSVAFTLAVGIGVGLSLLGFADAGLAHEPARLIPAWDRMANAHGWTEGLLGVEEIRSAGTKSLLRVLWGTTALVVASALVIAAARVLARGASQRPAIAMRVVLGAGAGRILRFVAADTVVPVLVGAVLGLCAGWGIGEILAATWPAAGDPWASDGGVRALLPAVVAPVGVALLCALAPVAIAYRRELASGLGTGDRATAGRYEGWVRRVVTVAQFTASMALLVGAGTLLRGSLDRQSGAGAGFDPRDTLTMSVTLPAAARTDAAVRAAYLRDTLDRVRALPGVRAASVVSQDAWLGTGPRDVVTSYCKPFCYAYLLVPVLQKDVHQLVASPGYFEAMGIPVLEGRALAPGDGRMEAVVTRSAGRLLFPGLDPVGQHLLPWRERSLLSAAQAIPKYRVVGVVDDVRPLGPGVGAMVSPTIYLSALRHPPRVVGLAVRTAGDPMRLAGPVQRAVRSAIPGALIRDVITMEERLARFAAPVRWTAGVLGALSAIGVVLACAGLFGVVREGVARRTREIGVRMALGARQEQVVRHVVGDAMRLARTSLILGTLAAIATARTLQGFFHGVRTWDPLLYAGVALLLTGVALLAAWLPARRAATVDPMVAIRAR
ncbi:MAG TPA: FtsX-like permease family protein [Longimicrobium sp.]|jgi:predicted permease